MVLVDVHSKWIDACVMPVITAAKTIKQLRIVFATHGLPRKVVTDNGPSFTSEELSVLQWDCSCPCHLSSNGLAERAVQTL